MSKKLNIAKTIIAPKPKMTVPEDTYNVAEQLARSGQIEAAKQLCNKMLEANPDHALTLHLLGNILANNRQIYEAEQLLIKASKLHPYSYKINSTLGYIYRLLNKNELADTHSKLAEQTNNYTNWIKKFDTLNPNTIHAMRIKLTQWHNPPKISILMQVYNTNLEWLKAAIDSVINQIYPHWELHIVDNASTVKNIRSLLENYSRQDTRIKINFRAIHEKISVILNSSLNIITGDYIALLNQDDLITIHALYFIAAEIIRHPNSELIYSDEDVLNALNERMLPHFKCDWNPDLFLTHNYISHLCVYKAELIRAFNGFRNGYENAYEYDLILRVIEQIKPINIRHVPHILYHKRIQKSITNLQFIHPKLIECETMQQAINEHLQRCNITAKVSESYKLHGTIRIQYTLPSILPLVSIIIPTRNKFKLLHTCVSSVIAKTNYTNFEIIIIDNQSDDSDTLEYLDYLHMQSLSRVIKYSHSFNYSAINNFAVQHAKGELICLLNNDTEIINESWLTEMVSHAMRPEIGAVGAKLWYNNNKLQHGGVIIGLGGVADHSHKHYSRGNVGYLGRLELIQNLSAVTSACMVMRKEVFNAAGGLNSKNLEIAFNDIDLCLKIISLGLRIVWTPFAELYHHESVSRGLEDTPEKKVRFNAEIAYMKKTWQHLLSNDPAYNPNLTIKNTNFAIANPPRVQINEIA